MMKLFSVGEEKNAEIILNSNDAQFWNLNEKMSMDGHCQEQRGFRVIKGERANWHSHALSYGKKYIPSTGRKNEMREKSKEKEKRKRNKIGKIFMFVNALLFF